MPQPGTIGVRIFEEDGPSFRWSDRRPAAAVEIFHAVRRMPYASTGRRTAADLVRDGRGACTAKHLLLRDLLASVDVPATIETVVGRFGEGLPISASMPDALQDMIREGGVMDYHHYVTATIDGRPLALDATWHDQLIPLGFEVNDGWTGADDTAIALEGRRLDDRPADLQAFKAAKIAALPPVERERRQVFLRLITEWISGLH